VATYNPINTFTKHLLEGVHNFTTAAHTFKTMLVNSPAPLATNVLKADLTEITPASGYTAGGPARVLVGLREQYFASQYRDVHPGFRPGPGHRAGWIPIADP
jgi:hypothetical protein